MRPGIVDIEAAIEHLVFGRGEYAVDLSDSFTAKARRREEMQRQTKILSLHFAFLRVFASSRLASSQGAPQPGRTLFRIRRIQIYQQGNIRIDSGKLRIGGEWLPLANIMGVRSAPASRPRRHWTTIILIAAAVVLAGSRFPDRPWGWALMLGGAVVGSWCWFFYRDRTWMVRLNLLLDQRIRILFNDQSDAEAFVAALTEAKQKVKASVPEKL
jgi:hypothetical protein